MNILPKKRWHVRNKDNVAKVRRDEENARKEELERVKRSEAAEKEARLDYMRKKNKTSPQRHEELPHTNRHINFFSEIEEEAGKSTTSNKEYEAEKKGEQEKFEKRIGLLTYLGQSELEAKDSKPWYLTPKPTETEDCEHSLGSQAVDMKEKMDPLKVMEKHLKRKKDKKKDKKHKKRRQDSDNPSNKSYTLEKLREERIKREKAERERAKRLLESQKSDTRVDEKEDYDPSRYSSQYHPELARQPKKWRK